MINSEIPLFGFVNNGWNGMERDGIHSIPFHPISHFLFYPIWDVCNGMRYLLLK